MVTVVDLIPSFLRPLTQPTPSGVAKLLAAWDGLQNESKIQILTYFNKLSNIEFPEYLHDQVRLRALCSDVPYIRYLASPGPYSSNKEMLERIANDPVPLGRVDGFDK